MRARLRPFVSIVILLGVLAAHDAMAAVGGCLVAWRRRLAAQPWTNRHTV